MLAASFHLNASMILDLFSILNLKCRYVVRKNPDATTDEERARLEVVGEYHVGKSYAGSCWRLLCWEELGWKLLEDVGNMMYVIRMPWMQYQWWWSHKPF
jgi:hypothetical protein